jgi:hypothetical protein
MTDPSMNETGEPAAPPRARLPKVELITSAMMNSETATPEGGLIAANHPSTAHPADKMFDLLVETDTDVTGHIAYSMTERTRRDWIAAFRAVQRREPTAAELEAFHLGEQLPRRLAAYRHMADDLLQRGRADKGGIVVPALPPQIAMPGAPQTMQQAARSPVTWRYIGFMLLLLVVMAIVFRMAAGWLFRA